MNNPRSYRNTASFGKRQEYIAVAELLKRGYDVYMTLVDDQQIDCIVRHDNGTRVKYVPLQSRHDLRLLNITINLGDSN